MSSARLKHAHARLVPVAQQHVDEQRGEHRAVHVLLRADVPRHEAAVDDEHHARDRAAHDEQQLRDHRLRAHEPVRVAARLELGQHRHRRLEEHQWLPSEHGQQPGRHRVADDDPRVHQLSEDHQVGAGDEHRPDLRRHQPAAAPEERARLPPGQRRQAPRHRVRMPPHEPVGEQARREQLRHGPPRAHGVKAEPEVEEALREERRRAPLHHVHVGHEGDVVEPDEHPVHDAERRDDAEDDEHHDEGAPQRFPAGRKQQPDAGRRHAGHERLPEDDALDATYQSAEFLAPGDPRAGPRVDPCRLPRHQGHQPQVEQCEVREDLLRDEPEAVVVVSEPAEQLGREPEPAAADDQHHQVARTQSTRHALDARHGRTRAPGLDVSALGRHDDTDVRRRTSGPGEGFAADIGTTHGRVRPPPRQGFERRRLSSALHGNPRGSAARPGTFCASGQPGSVPGRAGRRLQRGMVALRPARERRPVPLRPRAACTAAASRTRRARSTSRRGRRHGPVPAPPCAHPSAGSSPRPMRA